MYTQDELNNHANQLNPNNDAYWESRGFDERPDDWEDRISVYDDDWVDYDSFDFFCYENE
jgi:hypothetical protein